MAITTRVGGGVGTPTPIPANTSTPSPITSPSPTPTYSSSEVTWESDNLNNSSVDFSSDARAYGGQGNTTWQGTTEHATDNTNYFDASNDVYAYENDNFFDTSQSEVYGTENTSYSGTSTENFYSNNAAGSAQTLSRDDNATDNPNAPAEQQQNAGVNRFTAHPVLEGSVVPTAADSGPFSFSSFDDVFSTQTLFTDASSSNQHNDNSLSAVPASSPVSEVSSTADTQDVSDVQNSPAVATMEQRIADIERQQGHALVRHGGRVTYQQLEDRAMRGIDPASGTTSDAFARDLSGNPKRHSVGRHATAFTSDEAIVKADSYFRALPEFEEKVNKAKSTGEKLMDYIYRQLEDIYGSSYQDEVRGVTRLGSQKHPTGHQPTDFTDGRVTARYRIADNGDVDLFSMYPEIKPR